MRRRLLCGVIALLAIELGAWGASYRVGAVLHLRAGDHLSFVAVNWGDVEIGWWRRSEWNPFQNRIVHFDWGYDPAVQARIVREELARGSKFAGVGYVAFTQPVRTGSATFHEAVLPMWVFAVPTVLLALVLFRSYRRRRRWERRGLCSRCGYDLRASHDRCPECGEPFSTSPVSSSAS